MPSEGGKTEKVSKIGVKGNGRSFNKRGKK